MNAVIPGSVLRQDQPFWWRAGFWVAFTANLHNTNQTGAWHGRPAQELLTLRLLLLGHLAMESADTTHMGAKKDMI